jgi:hypothetical protein
MQETAFRSWLHKIATALILHGFVLLCQPLTVALYALGFPTLLLGVVLFIIADHLPTPRPDDGHR